MYLVKRAEREHFTRCGDRGKKARTDKIRIKVVSSGNKENTFRVKYDGGQLDRPVPARYTRCLS